MDIEFVHEYLEKLKQEKHQVDKKFHELEQWRDRMITEGDVAINQFIENYPDTDRQLIRSLTRKAKKEIQQNETARSSRQLFRYIRDLMHGKS